VETAIIYAPREPQRSTDPTLEIGGWPEPRASTPLISQSIGASIVAGAFDLAGGDVLVRIAGRDAVDSILRGWTLTERASATADLVPTEPGPKPALALDAAHQLMELFEISMESLATASGVGRTTILHWQREGSSPRPSTVRSLWRLYGVGMGLRAVLGVAGTRSWLRSGSNPPLTLLNSGDIAAFEQLASRMVFDSGAAREFEPGIETAEAFELAPPERFEAARGSRHRQRRPSVHD
jgi:hypothetical protein